MMIALILALQAACVPDCPTSRAHIQSVDHTQGKACPGCGARIDVCFQRCAACAAGACRGCGGRAVEAKTWKGVDGPVGIRLVQEKDFSVLAIVQGEVFDSQRARLLAVQEFDDRIVVTYATRTPQCGSEPRAFDALHVRVPRSAKRWVVRHAHTSIPLGLKMSTAAEFPARP
jgi:hypothetical protein